MLRVGASGWSHADWVGPFYPVAMRDQPEAWLDHYAARFRTVEITSTFDIAPDADLVEAWCREGVRLQSRGPFDFSLKLPARITHDALPAGDLDDALRWAGRFDREVLDPLAGEDLLGALLIQLPRSYHASERHVHALQSLLGVLVERRVALEFRHDSWTPDGRLDPVADPLFGSADVALAEIDRPVGPPVENPMPARHAYVRLHGRRSDAWLDARKHDGSRYDYRYAERELVPWADRVRSLERATRDVRVYFNNTPRANAPADALAFLDLLGQAPAVPRPRLTRQTRLRETGVTPVRGKPSSPP